MYLGARIAAADGSIPMVDILQHLSSCVTGDAP